MRQDAPIKHKSFVHLALLPDQILNRAPPTKANSPMIKSEEDPMLRELQKIASDLHLEMDSPAFAKHLDARDELSPLRSDFLIPKRGGVESTYLLGNSLGLQPKAVRALLEEELEVWAEKANEGHFNHTFGRPWLTVDEECARLTLPLVGAVPDEVAIMGSLTANLHLLLCAFYHPTPERYKIIIESKAFPSDHVPARQVV